MEFWFACLIPKSLFLWPTYVTHIQSTGKSLSVLPSKHTWNLGPSHHSCGPHLILRTSKTDQVKRSILSKKQPHMQRFNGLRKCGCLGSTLAQCMANDEALEERGQSAAEAERSRGKQWTATWAPACSCPQSFLRARCILDKAWCGILNRWTQFFTPLLLYYISTPSQGLLVRKNTSLPFHSGLGLGDLLWATEYYPADVMWTQLWNQLGWLLCFCLCHEKNMPWEPLVPEWLDNTWIQAMDWSQKQLSPSQSIPVWQQINADCY